MRCPHCGVAKHWYKGGDGDPTCLICGFVQMTREVSEELGKAGRPKGSTYRKPVKSGS